MTSKKSFGYNELFSSDIPNLECFVAGFENKIKTMIVEKQNILFENLPDSGIAKANINTLTRPEQMTLKDFLNLTEIIYQNK